MSSKAGTLTEVSCLLRRRRVDLVTEIPTLGTAGLETAAGFLSGVLSGELDFLILFAGLSSVLLSELVCFLGRSFPFFTDLVSSVFLDLVALTWEYCGEALFSSPDDSAS